MEKGKVDIELIRRYIRGELSPREMYALERRAQDDPVLMDIILGMEQETQELHAANLVDIRKRIALRAGHGRTRRLAPAQRWAVAASVLVAVTLGTLWLTQRLTVGESQPDIASVPAEAEVHADDTAAEPPHQPAAPAKKEAIPETPKRVAAAPAAIPPRADRVALRTEKPAKPEDTLDEVVVGYGTQKKMDLTGAVDTPVQISEQALAGRAAGVQVRDAYRKAATDTPTEIRIRGISPNAKPDTISGKVIDAETQKPLSGVVVQLAENRAVVTDSSGTFTITGLSNMLNATLLGYELQNLKIVGKDSIVVVMEPSEALLSEVSVVDHRTKATKPEPEIGWRAYNRYIRKGARQIKGPNGQVTLTFTIDDEGTPTEIRIIHTTDASLDERAIQLVREGSKWKPGRNGERKAELRVKF